MRLKKEQKELQTIEQAAAKKKQYNIREKDLLVGGKTKPVNFTYNDQGKVIFKKKLVVENMPSHIEQGIDYINISSKE